MSKIKCLSTECKYNKNDRCTAKEVSFIWKSVMTVHDGRLECWICRQYEMSDEMKRISDSIRKCVPTT